MPRPHSAFLDTAIDSPLVKVLDHGFVRVVDYCGDELAIERAARQSYAEDPQRACRKNAGRYCVISCVTGTRRRWKCVSSRCK